MRLKSLLLLSAIIIIPFLATAQSTDIPSGSKDEQFLDRLEIKYGKLPSSFSSEVKPISREAAVKFALKADSANAMSTGDYWESVNLSRIDQYNLRKLFADNGEWAPDSVSFETSKHPLLKTFYKDKTNFYEVNNPDLFLVINPIAQLRVGKENNTDETLFLNTRGIEVRGLIAKKLGFYTQFTENQERGPLYVQHLINGYQAVPGAGFYKNYNGTGVDYITASGYISFIAAKYIDIQFGYGNNFLGDGYRSMFLSDFSSNYLYLKLHTHVWKLDYQNIFAELIAQYPRNGDYLRPKKYMAEHRLGIDLTHWLNFGLFESVIFSRKDHFEFQYLNPIIFYRAIEQAVGSPDNANLGFDAKADIAHHFQLYGQFMFDELRIHDFLSSDKWWGNKWAAQLGGKYVDAFGINNLDLQGEINIVRPYTYSHYDSVANYSNYNLPLADPVGANFKEFIGMIRYQPINRLRLSARAIYYSKGYDPAGENWGGDIFKNYRTHEMDYGNVIDQGIKGKVLNMSFLASYELKDNLFLEAGFTSRHTNRADEVSMQQTNYFNGGLRWNIARREYDY